MDATIHFFALFVSQQEQPVSPRVVAAEAVKPLPVVSDVVSGARPPVPTKRSSRTSGNPR